LSPVKHRQVKGAVAGPAARQDSADAPHRS
jgi:hypothetical protein